METAETSKNAHPKAVSAATQTCMATTRDGSGRQKGLEEGILIVAHKIGEQTNKRSGNAPSGIRRELRMYVQHKKVAEGKELLVNSHARCPL